MTSIRFLALAAFAAAVSSCANRSVEQSYDTANPYGVPSSGGAAVQQPATPDANPTYDTPAAYEESTASAPAPESTIVDPGLSTPRGEISRPTPTSSVPAAAGATVHVVAKGDTLGGIAKKYGVSQAAIKQANGMTSDVVVLGRKMQIPAR